MSAQIDLSNIIWFDHLEKSISLDARQLGLGLVWERFLRSLPYSTVTT